MPLTHLSTAHKVLMFPVVCLLLLTISHYSFAKNNAIAAGELNVKPQRCVALRKGQICYQEVLFSWQQAKQGNYCLVEVPNEVVLHCWQQAKSGSITFDFQASQSREYALREQHQTANLEIGKITVAWVFKSSQRPKSSWKLF